MQKSVFYSRCLPIFLSVLLLLPLFLQIGLAEERAPSFPAVSAKAAVLIEAESGNVIFQKNADERLPMASTTKIMTAVTALSLAAPEKEIAVSPQAIGVEGSSVYLVAGEVLTLEELLYALLLESANDAAAAIAIGLCGSIEAFADEMNKLANAWGVTNTHFVNPHGLDDEEHYTTARELAVITQKALQNETFSKIVSTRKTTIPHASPDAARLLINHNKMLRFYEGCIGVKTGYTQRSGRCLVSAATRQGVTVIAVTLHASDDWDDHTKLLDYGFSVYERVELVAAGTLSHTLTLTGGDTETLTVSNPTDAFAVLPVSRGEIKAEICLPHFAYAPLNAGDMIGKAVFYCDINSDGILEYIGEVPLSITENIPQKSYKKSFWQWLCSLFDWKK